MPRSGARTTKGAGGLWTAARRVRDRITSTEVGRKPCHYAPKQEAARTWRVEGKEAKMTTKPTPISRSAFVAQNGLLDDINRRLLSELHADPRIGMSALARRVKMSAPAVTERVQRLERAGVITGYRLEVDPAALGLPVTAFARIRPAAGQLVQGRRPGPVEYPDHRMPPHHGRRLLSGQGPRPGGGTAGDRPRPVPRPRPDHHQHRRDNPRATETASRRQRQHRRLTTLVVAGRPPATLCGCCHLQRHFR